MKKLATLILALVLVSATALAFTGCDIMVVGYEVSYARGNEAATGEVPAANEYSSGAKITLAENPFTLENYVFGGWSDGEKTYAAGEEYTVPSRKVTLSAVWKKVEYKLDFAAGAAEATGEAPLATSCAWGETVILPENTFVYNGYAFVGWTDGKKTYAAGDEFVMPLAAVTLTAVWEKAFTVRFLRGGEEIGIETQYVVNGGVAVKPADPTDPAKTFRYWEITDPETDESFEYDFSTPVTSDIVLEAVFRIVASFEIGEGATGTAPVAQEFKTTPNFLKPFVFPAKTDDMAKEGYAFIGWTDGEGTYATGYSDYTLDKSTVFTAVWDDKYTITFNPANGEEKWTVEVQIGDTLEKPATDPVNSNGKTFRYWKNGNKEYKFGTAVTANFELTADYAALVSFDLGEGVEGEAPASVWATGYSGAMLPKTVPTRSGYAFKGWTDGKATYQPGAKYKTSVSVTLTAVWSDKATVSYVAGEESATGAAPASVEVKMGEKTVLPANTFTVAGAEFVGWSDKKATYAAGAEYTVNGDVTFTAVWKVVYAYAYDSNYTMQLFLPDSRDGSYDDGYIIIDFETLETVLFSYTVSGTTLKVTIDSTEFTGTVSNGVVNITIVYNGKTHIFNLAG